jgi:ribosomal protein S18 acetylase RimI-like enzyme
MAMIGRAAGLIADPCAPPPRVTLEVAGPEAWAYCHQLACSNMTPYLERRGQRWNVSAWLDRASSREFLLVIAGQSRAGFASIHDDRDNHALHLGDLQLEPEARGRGIGSACLELITDIARRRAWHGVKLHVFRDNPARRLYARHGFRTIDRSFDKLTLWRPIARP